MIEPEAVNPLGSHLHPDKLTSESYPLTGEDDAQDPGTIEYDGCSCGES